MQKYSTIKISIVALLLTFPAAQAAPINYGDFGSGTVMFNQIPNLTITAVNDGNPAGDRDLAVVFDTNAANDTANDPDLESLFYLTPADKLAGINGFNPGKVLILQENNIGCSAAGDMSCTEPDDEGTRFRNGAGDITASTGVISFEFAQAIELLSMDFFDIEANEDGDSFFSRIDLFDAVGNPVAVGDYFVPNTGGDNLWARLLFDQNDPDLHNIGKIDVYLAGSGAIGAINAVPVPAAFWLFGTALIGFIGFSRRTSV